MLTQPETILLTEKQQAARIPCSPRHLVNMRNRRLIPYIKFGRLVRYDPVAVARALEKLTVKEVG